MKYYLGFILIMSLITFVSYWADKRKSIKGKWRISEKTLLLLSLFGGACGGTLAMHLFRHKTKHFYFWFTNLSGIVLHCVLALWIAKSF